MGLASGPVSLRQEDPDGLAVPAVEEATVTEGPDESQPCSTAALRGGTIPRAAWSLRPCGREDSSSCGAVTKDQWANSPAAGAREHVVPSRKCLDLASAPWYPDAPQGEGGDLRLTKTEFLPPQEHGDAHYKLRVPEQRGSFYYWYPLSATLHFMQKIFYSTFLL